MPLTLPRDVLILIFQYHPFWTQKNVYRNYFLLSSVCPSWNDALTFIRQTHRHLFQQIFQQITPIQKSIPVQPLDYRWRWTARKTEQYFDSYFYKARRFLEIKGISERSTAKTLSKFLKNYFRQVRVYSCAWQQKSVSIMCWKPRAKIDIS